MSEAVVAFLTLACSIVLAFVTARMSARNDLEKLREEMKLDYSVEAAIRHLLENQSYQKRSLKKIKHHLRGFENDDALRMALIRAGAVAFSGSGEDEMWGLVSRNREDFR
ncbi:hypothetical protein [uncultured Roseobacter sp.]|uniref:hypothetical protein n=1 Tax=uncultured Roseobacter sp. TaxID=114847 RepID=UPI00260B95B5|nr:hypothetical protein [uncultured Roseobacter sp.]